MKLKTTSLIKTISYLFFTFLFVNNNIAATVTSAATGNWSNATTWNITTTKPGTISCNTSSRTVTGSSLASFTTTLSIGSQVLNTSNVVIGTVASIESNTSLTLQANATSTLTSAGWNSRGVGPGDDVTISSGHTITVDNNYSCATLSFAAAATNNVLTISGTSTLTVNGLVSMPNPNLSRSSVININNGSLICNSLTTSGTTATRFTNINITNGLLDVNGTYTSSNASGATITVTGTGTVQFSGAVSTLFTLTPGTSSTVIYDMASAQTVRPVTYNNLTLGGSGSKTTATTTVNGTLKIEGTATMSAAATMGASSAIVFNTATSRTITNNEWPSTFAGSGGVTITNTGVITLNAAKILSDNTSTNLTITSGATLSTNNFGLTFNGNFVNAGNLSAGSSSIVITGTLSTQNIGPISTTGTISSTKSAGTAIFNGNITAGTLTLNGSGSSLSLGSNNYTHSFGTVTLTAGTLLGGNSLTYISGNVSKTSGSFTPEASTIDFNGAAQTISISLFNNLILSGSGTKSISATSGTITQNFTLKGTTSYTSIVNWTINGNVSVEETSTLNLGGATISIDGNLVVGNGPIANFIISGDAGSKTIYGDFTVSNNSTFNNTINEVVTIGGNINIQGTASFGNGTYTLTGNTKTISGNITIPSLSINGTYTNNGNLTISNNLLGSGTLTNGINSTLTLNTNSISISNLDASSNINTINYGLNGNQTIYGTKYHNLTLSGSGTKAFQTLTYTILGNLTLTGTASTSFLTNLAINGNLSISSGSNFIGGSYSHTIKGNISISSGGIATWTGSTLILSGNKQSYTDLNSVKNALNNLTLTGNGLKTVSIASILGNIVINDNDSLKLDNATITIAGTTTIGNGSSGYLNIQNTGGAKIFTGDFVLNSNALFDNSHTTITFQGNATFNGTFYAGAGTYIFSGTNKFISGNSAISLINLTINGTVTFNNTGSLNVSGSFNGSGKFINAGTLYITSSTAISVSQLNASYYQNIVHYSGSNQVIYGTNYYNLSLSNTGTKTMANSMDSIYGNLSISGNVTFNSTDNLVILGNLSTSSNANLSLGFYSYSIAGNISLGSSTTFNFSNAILTLNGATQNISNATASTLILNTVTLIGGQKTFVNNTYFYGNLNLNSDATLVVGATSTMYFVCTFSGTGKIAGTNCANLTNRNLSFELTSSTMGTVYIDPSNNCFGRIAIKNNASITIENDVQIFEYLDLGSGIITINGALFFTNSNTPILRTSGLLSMTTNSSIIFGGCNSLGANFTIPTNTFITPPTLAYLMINRTNGVSLGTNTINISDALYLVAGTLQISTGNLILKSTASKTARVAQISGTANISGNVTVERFIPGGTNKRKWRFLSSPINVGGVTSLTQFKDDIFVTAPAGTGGGFDNSPQNNASIRTYNEPTTGAASLGWTNPTNINNTITTGTGLEVFVRGSRNLANPYLNWTVPDDVTIDYFGNLNMGNYDVVLSYTNTGNTSADGFNLVGNPYASPINFDTTGWTKSNIQNKFWSYNPNTGAYGVYDADLNTGTNSITQYIASGQGFFVKATAASSKITFTESVKCLNSGNNYFKTNENQSIYPVIKIGISNDSTYSDETMLVLDENASALANDEHDANKWFSDALNIYTLSSDNINLNIDARKTPSHIDSIKLAVFSYNGTDVMTTSHTIVVNGLNTLPIQIDAVLWDKFLNTYTDLKVNSRYEFMITSDINSYGKDRFIILLGDVNIGIPDNYNHSVLKVFPNPSKGELNLTNSEEWLNKEIKYSIIDQSGRILKSTNIFINNLNTKIDISDVIDGFYVLEIISEQKTSRIKFIKRQ